MTKTTNMISALALASALGAALATAPLAFGDEMQKCYGVALKGQNFFNAG